EFFFMNYHPENFHGILIGGIIGAVDLYLIAVVMLLFAFGLYELFISKIDDAEKSEAGNKILAIHSLDELKDKLGKVVIMVLIVSFFKKVINMNFNTPLEMMYFAGSILALALALYFMHKGH
ncbi:MAG: YqhA family protein, partial [Nitrospiraceae bacterium]|nr:YqhA family protein [Nitrospiraceae bacterium]